MSQSVTEPIDVVVAKGSQLALTETLLAGQNHLLELVAKGAPLKETLIDLTLLIESQHEGLFCSVLLLDEDGVTIRQGAGPNLPDSYMRALEGFAIGPTAGSCGTAMYRKETVVVSDIETDPLWAPYRELIAPHGFRACWSCPIFLNADTVLGTFAMYYREVRTPTPSDMTLIGVATHIAGIAIERTRREKELLEHRNHLEELIQTRTNELTAAKERAESGLLALTQANRELASALNSLSIAQEELVRSKKLAALGSLVAGIAHELNTPIGNGMIVASTLADKSVAFAEHYDQTEHNIKRSELEAYIANVREASDLLVRNLNRAGNLITSFKQVAVDQTSAYRRNFLLNELVSEIVLTLWPTIGKSGIKVEQAIPPDIQFDSHPGPLGQVLTNLIQNSLLHAFEGRSSGQITLAAAYSDAQSIKLAIKDDGIGIPSDLMDRIYDPFFTTKLGNGGSGLGLNIVHNIVTGMLGGHIECESQVNLGTVFTLTLPKVAPSSGNTLQTSARLDED